MSGAILICLLMACLEAGAPFSDFNIILLWIGLAIIMSLVHFGCISWL